jgi:hypothetical protein
MFLPRVARSWLALLGFVAGVVQLISAPWPLWVRLTIFGALFFAALLLVAYFAGVRRGEGSAQKENAESPPLPAKAPTSGWTSEQLEGRQFVKVDSDGVNVFICTLGKGGQLDERLLPLTADDAHEFHGGWSGSWFLQARLHILVAGHHLLLQPSLKGTWTGVEIFGREQRPFIGAVIDPAGIVAGRSWVALRLMSGSPERRLMVAKADGSMLETDLYERSTGRAGTWSADSAGIHLEVGGEHSLLEHWTGGVLINPDRENGRGREFVVVPVCAHP